MTTSDVTTRVTTCDDLPEEDVTALYSCLDAWSCGRDPVTTFFPIYLPHTSPTSRPAVRPLHPPSYLSTLPTIVVGSHRSSRTEGQAENMPDSRCDDPPVTTFNCDDLGRHRKPSVRRYP